MNNKKFNLADLTFTGVKLNPDNKVFRHKVRTFQKDLELLKDDSLDATEKQEIKTRIRVQFEVLKLMIAKTVIEMELPLNAA